MGCDRLPPRHRRFEAAGARAVRSDVAHNGVMRPCTIILAGCLIATSGARAADDPARSRGIHLAGESVEFGTDGRPRFTAAQTASSSEAVRRGLAKWASTASGRALIARFHGGPYRVMVEDRVDVAIGRAPEPGMGTLLAANDPSQVKTYSVILSPKPKIEIAAVAIRRDEAIEPSDVMATAWAAEMLHVDFYSRGVPLPHHDRKDFQQAWRTVAEELGFPTLQHGHEADDPRPRVRVLGQSSPPRR